MLTAVCEVLLSPPLGMCTHWSQPQGKGGVGEVHGALVVLMVELMDLQAWYPQWLIGGFPDRVSKAIGRIHVLLPSKSPAASPCPTVMQHTTVFWIG